MAQHTTYIGDWSSDVCSPDLADTATTTPPTCSTTATTSSHVNSYPITCSGAADNDYTITYKPGSLTVTPRSEERRVGKESRACGAASLPTQTFKYVGTVNAGT